MTSVPSDLAVGEPLGEELDLGLLCGGALDGPDDSPDHGVEADAVDLNLELAVLDDGGGEHRVARRRSTGKASPVTVC